MTEANRSDRSGAARAGQSTVDPAEVARFSALAQEWWDPKGPFRPLHKLNPARLTYIRDRLARHYGRDQTAIDPFDGLRVLDIGCGGGLLCEPLRRMGAAVTGADASEKNIEIARLHARGAGLDIDYRVTAAETLADEGAQYDAIINMEVVEHVVDVGAFLSACRRLLKPGGAMVASTLNRTAKSFLLGVLGAEYVLGWIPRGTHDWRKFMRPGELSDALAIAGFRVEDTSGLSFRIGTGDWVVSADTSINYMMFAIAN